MLREGDSLCSKSIKIRTVNLRIVVTDVGPAQVIRKNQDDVWLRLRRVQTHRHAKGQR